MKLSIELSGVSKKEWINAVLNDFDAFLQDHADCERKASAMAMSLVAKYPDRLDIIPELIETAREEIEHFQQVYMIMESRGVQLVQEIPKDMYMVELLKSCKSGREERFIDRLLLASIVECRGAERFKIVYQNLEEGELKTFYHNLWASEAKHGNIFVKMALHYASEEEVYGRLKEWDAIEMEILNNLKIRPALH